MVFTSTGRGDVFATKMSKPSTRRIKTNRRQYHKLMAPLLESVRRQTIYCPANFILPWDLLCWEKWLLFLITII